MKIKPDLSFWKLWNISFGFFGVQIAYALQSANISRIFATLGADPHNLSYFWILPPLAGIIIQPIVGYASDRTWTRFGRRYPLFVHRFSGRRISYVPFTECRKFCPHYQCHAIRAHSSDVPRYLYQYGHATF